MTTQHSGLDRRIPELDGIRGIAIWMVMLGHVFFLYGADQSAAALLPAPVFQLLSHGWLGVDLFFILSGFLITRILIDTKTGSGYFRGFYTRRFLRIMPAYFAAIIVWSVWYKGFGSYFLLSSVFGANLAPLFHIPRPHGPNVLWSLAVEEHFYLLWPVIVLSLNRRLLFASSAAIFIAMPILRGVYTARGMDPELLYQLSWFRFDGLACGAMIAIGAGSSYYSTRNARRAVTALAASLIVMSAIGAPFGIFAAHSVAAAALRLTQAYLLFGAFFILVLAHPGSIWASPLRSAPLRLTGALSYCLYLIHLSIGDAYEYLVKSYRPFGFENLGPTGVVALRASVMIVASFIVALLSRRYLEEPFINLKGRFTQKRADPRILEPRAELTGA